MFGRDRSAGKETPYGLPAGQYDSPTIEVLPVNNEIKFARKVLSIVKDASFEAEAGPGDILSFVLPEDVIPVPDATEIRMEIATLDNETNNPNPPLFLGTTTEDGSTIAHVQLV